MSGVTTFSPSIFAGMGVGLAFGFAVADGAATEVGNCANTTGVGVRAAVRAGAVTDGSAGAGATTLGNAGAGVGDAAVRVWVNAPQATKAITSTANPMTSAQGTRNFVVFKVLIPKV